MTLPRKPGSATAAARRSLATYRIDGDNVTLEEIAVRLGITKQQASTRLQTERQRPGRITWESLRR